MNRAVAAGLVAVCLSACGHGASVRADGVQPGFRQEPLGTRAAAFAQYIIAMHRKIHRLFTNGFLADIDAHKDPTYADETLWTQLDIVVNSDGTVDHIGVRRKSGLLAFDVAAIDSVMVASPFPPAPPTIESVDGKVHLDWQFHRDERACGAFGVDPHIFSAVGHETANGLGEAIAQAKARRKQEASAGDVGQAREAAEGWFGAYRRRDAAWLAGWSAVPFTRDGDVIAHDGATLKRFYGEMVAAEPAADRAVTGVKVLTPAELRGEPRKLPPDGEPPELLYAVGYTAGEEITLLLRKSSQGWRVCGMKRRAPVAL